MLEFLTTVFVMVFTPPGIWAVAIFWFLSFIWYSLITGKKAHLEILENIGWSTKLTGYLLMMLIACFVVVKIIWNVLDGFFVWLMN